jgi:hypothetical protein
MRRAAAHQLLGSERRHDGEFEGVYARGSLNHGCFCQLAIIIGQRWNVTSYRSGQRSTAACSKPHTTLDTPAPASPLG